MRPSYNNQCKMAVGRARELLQTFLFQQAEQDVHRSPWTTAILKFTWVQVGNFTFKA